MASTGAALTEFLLARIGEDEAAVASIEGPAGVSFEQAFRLAGWAERSSRIPSVALDFACPTCHAKPGATCMAMTPPHHAPKAADSLHVTRCALAQAEIRRRYGDNDHRHRWGFGRIAAHCAAHRAIVENATNMHTSGPEWDEAVRLLAAVYSDHPDYDEEWRP